MSTTVEDPTTVRELTRCVQDAHPNLDTSYDADLDQLLVVGQPGKPEPPAALREVLVTEHFEIQDQQATGRSRWVAIVNPADGRDR
jgi:hypothetical protein